MSLGNASYKQSQSALKHLFRMSKYAMQTNFFDNLKQFTKGIRRHVADKKVLEGDVTMVGKKKMGFNVYKKICEKFMQEGGEEYIFSHAFVTLEWNLMARSENVVNAHILHVHWDADCLVFRFVKSKGDQTGKNRDQEWHVYANPHTPSVCPVLALGCYIFANPGVFSMSTAEVDAMNGADVDSMNNGGVVEEGTADGEVEDTADGPRAGRRLPRKDACSLVNVSTIDSWDAFIVSSRSIWTNFLRWVSLQAIWARTRRGKVQAAMPQAAQLSLRQWSPSAFARCGAWGT